MLATCIMEQEGGPAACESLRRLCARFYAFTSVPGEAQPQFMAGFIACSDMKGLGQLGLFVLAGECLAYWGPEKDRVRIVAGEGAAEFSDMCLADTVTVRAYPFGGLAVLANHRCVPTFIVKHSSEKQQHVALLMRNSEVSPDAQARAAMEEGWPEVTYIYAAATDDPDEEIRCLCGLDLCTGYVCAFNPSADVP